MPYVTVSAKPAMFAPKLKSIYCTRYVCNGYTEELCMYPCAVSPVANVMNLLFWQAFCRPCDVTVKRMVGMAMNCFH